MKSKNVMRIDWDNYLWSAHYQKQEWEDYLNEKFSEELDDNKIKVSVEQGDILFEIGQFHEPGTVGTKCVDNQLNHHHYIGKNASFRFILGHLIDLDKTGFSKLESKEEDDGLIIDRKLLGNNYSNGDYYFNYCDGCAERQFFNKDRYEKHFLFYEGFYVYKDETTYSNLCLYETSLKFIKDPQLIKFATDDFNNRELPVFNKIKQKEEEIKKLKETINTDFLYYGEDEE